MPERPWVMTQTWHDLLFAHWPMDARTMQAALPAGFDLDLYDGQAWLAVVPFRMTNVTARGLPNVPGLSAFPELNVRTYVRVGGKPGVYFFSLDASNVVAVQGARWMFHLPYFGATMRVTAEESGAIAYRSERVTTAPGPRAVFDGRYAPSGPVALPVSGTLEHFLTERYCLHTLNAENQILTVDIHHPPWPLQPATAEIGRNTMAEAAGFALPETAPLLHFSRRQDVVAWAPRRADGT